MLLSADGTVCRLPSSWTDAHALDPYAAISAGRSKFRIEDLREMIIFISDLQKGVE